VKQKKGDIDRGRVDFKAESLTWTPNAPAAGSISTSKTKPVTVPAADIHEFVWTPQSSQSTADSGPRSRDRATPQIAHPHVCVALVPRVALRCVCRLSAESPGEGANHIHDAGLPSAGACACLRARLSARAMRRSN
jgi:hypothetical protein